MNRSQRIAIWVLTLIGLLAAWKLFGQGFGNFRTDQPFLARNYPVATAPTLPLQANLLWRFVAADVPDGAATVWTNRVTPSLLINYSNTVSGESPVKQQGGIYFANASASDVKNLTNKASTAFTTPNSNSAYLIVTSNALPIYSALYNGGLFWGQHDQGYGFRLRDNNAGSVTWEWDENGGEAGEDILANFGATMPQGVQAMLLFGSPVNACYTNRVLSATNLSVNSTYSMERIGRTPNWVNASAFRGYILELIVWTNATDFTSSNLINSAFDYVTNTYGKFGP